MTRRRYRYDPGLKEVIEITSDWTDVERRAPVATEAITYSNLRAIDGTPVDSRRKHRDYMRATNTALMSDFTETWARTEKERAEILSGPAAKRDRLEDLKRTAFELSKRRR